MMEQTAFDLVAFDCDGTLMDSEFLNNAAMSKVLAELGLPEYTPERCVADFVGNRADACFRMALEKAGRTVPEDCIARFEHATLNLMEDCLRPVEDAPEIVAAVPCKRCVVSNGQRPVVLKSLDALGPGASFPPEHVFTGESADRPKPFPDIYLYAFEKMGVAPERALVVEDSPTGAESGVRAGAFVVGFTGTAHDPEQRAKDLRNAGVHVVTNQLIHILPILNGGKKLVSGF